MNLSIYLSSVNQYIPIRKLTRKEFKNRIKLESQVEYKIL